MPEFEFESEKEEAADKIELDDLGAIPNPSGRWRLHDQEGTHVRYTGGDEVIEPPQESAYEGSVEPDEESAARADALSEKLMRDVRGVVREKAPAAVFNEVFSDERFARYAEGAQISDVIDNVRQMADEFAFARRLDLPMLCCRTDDGPIPVSLRGISGGSGSQINIFRYGDPKLIRDLARSTIELQTHLDPQLQTVQVGEAEESAHFNLRSFLAYRFWGSKENREVREGELQHFIPERSTIAPAEGLKIEVVSQKPGLRVHIAPAYFVDDWVFFGHPTTPVDGYVLPGRYIFSADGPVLPRRRIDPTIFKIPPSLKVKITRF